MCNKFTSDISHNVVSVILSVMICLESHKNAFFLTCFSIQAWKALLYVKSRTLSIGMLEIGGTGVGGGDGGMVAACIWKGWRGTTRCSTS